MRFRDPFNETTGVSAFRRVLEKMYEDVREPQFTISDRALSGNVCYMRWRFDYRFKDGSPAPAIDGVSEVHFDPQGRVTVHLDHWDAAGQLYEHLPFIGTLMRWLRRRLAADLGILLPKVRIRDNMQLDKRTYRIKIYGEPVAEGTLFLGLSDHIDCFIPACGAAQQIQQLQAQPTVIGQCVPCFARMVNRIAHIAGAHI